MQEGYEMTDLKNIFEKYFIAYDSNGEIIAVNKEDKSISNDEDLIDKLLFFNAWFKATSKSTFLKNMDYNNQIKKTFSGDYQAIYNIVMYSIEKEYEKSGLIDIDEICDYLKCGRCIEGMNIAMDLLSDEESFNITNKIIKKIFNKKEEKNKTL